MKEYVYCSNKFVGSNVAQEIAIKLNSSGSGPQKLPKEWNKAFKTSE